MIVESIIGAVTLITLGAMALTNAVEKRVHEREERDEGHEREERDEGPKVKILPYVYPAVGSKNACPLCGVCESSAKPEHGPRAPQACIEGEKCPAFPAVHLHVHCGYCQGRWYMKPKT